EDPGRQNRAAPGLVSQRPERGKRPGGASSERDISSPGESNEEYSQRPEPTAQTRTYLEDNGAPGDQPQTCDVNNQCNKGKPQNRAQHIAAPGGLELASGQPRACRSKTAEGARYSRK